MAFEVIQITDTHLFENNFIYWNKTRCNMSFLNILAQIHSIKFEKLAAVFLTGDISEDKTVKSYEFIAESLNDFNLPILWIPGNHDDFDIMKKTFNNYKNFFYQIKYSLQNWDFVFVNTKIEGKDYGYIEPKNLTEIEDKLKESVELSRHICIIMHHHPVLVGTSLIDNLMLQESNKFINIVKKYNKNIKLVVFGHVHNDYKILKYKVHFESALASSVQLIPGSKKLNLDYKSGFKVLKFFENGAFESKTYKIDSVI